ncbi:hypothetical protein [Sphingopyxis sp. KK2]|uniref:hypothetical protein n=1 Tax=Sphingopyxis sp. KK2 TaxID=1855727 RepID=UPI00097E6C64|nr:hypothetical protein [Sphingopyxis sp. KK2]
MAVWVGLFWAATYLLLSVRAALITDGTAMWFSPLRLASISAGALLFGFALRAGMRSPQLARQPALLLFHVLAAAVAIFAFGYTVDHIWSTNPYPLSGHIRWILTWTGYFGLGLAAFLAVNQSRAKARTRSQTAVAIPAATAQPIADTTTDAWSFAVDVLADELAKQPSRDALIAALERRAGYELADDVDATATAHNARAQLVAALADRLKRAS